MMNDKPELSKSAQRVQNTLVEQGHAFNVREFSASTRTAAEAALALGCDVAQIVKSLIFKTAQEHKPILILVSGVNRVDEKVIAHALGEKIVKADAEFTKAVTGFTIGGIPPLGHIQPITTLIDVDLLQFDELWAAAGTPNAVFNLHSADLVTLTKGKIISVTASQGKT
jgi:prolyl-tRNA editing enzyme YbaK/EbsC (Cys-tRNA(Pro) deacylase)